MKIALLAPLVESVPPRGYGGTELIVHLLGEMLHNRGHQVSLFASAGSQTSGQLIPCAPQPLREFAPRERWAAYDLAALLQLEKRQHEFDIIHNHMGWQALPFLRSMTSVVLSTLHNPIKEYCAPIYLQCKSLPYVAISHAYRRLNYPDQLNYLDVVHNGIDLERQQYIPGTKRSFLLFIGRIDPDKGTAVAIQIALKLGLPLKIAGKVDQRNKDYFNSQVKPFLNDKTIEYVGEVDFDQKNKLYNDAIAVIYPVQFDEPFGLVMVEALASGTPVMALDRGSVSEVLTNETAVICKTEQELVDQFPRILQINAEACRLRAEELFSKERMVADYERIYSQLLQAN